MNGFYLDGIHINTMLINNVIELLDSFHAKWKHIQISIQLVLQKSVEDLYNVF